MKLKHILTIASLLVATLGEAQSVGPDTTRMNIDAHTWTRNVRLGWNLGNQLECGGTGLNWETSWGNPRVTIKTIKAVKAAGFNAESHISEGTAHEFLTWRRALRQMALSLFK